MTGQPVGVLIQNSGSPDPQPGEHRPQLGGQQSPVDRPAPSPLVQRQRAAGCTPTGSPCTRCSMPADAAELVSDARPELGIPAQAGHPHADRADVQHAAAAGQPLHHLDVEVGVAVIPPVLAAHADDPGSTDSCRARAMVH